MQYEGVVISDIHFGVINSQELYKELKNKFLDYLESKMHSSIDFIIIDGDYFDHKLYVNERTTSYAIEFMTRLCSISSELGDFPIRVIYGTESHEVNQYNIFYTLEEEFNFKVIRTVSDEELCKGLNVLYIPEEHIKDKKRYYEEYLSRKDYYDYIFGHGIIEEGMQNASRSIKKDTQKEKPPIFKSKELSYACKGKVYFGHYHINSEVDDNVFYVGSFSRWAHGEIEPKGFYHVKCDTKKGKYTHTFIENDMARKYVTYIFGYNDIALNEDKIIEELDKRDKLSKLNNIEYVKYVFNIPEDHPNPEFIINILNERYRNDKKTKIETVNGYISKKERIKKKQVSEIIEKFPLVFDKYTKIEDKIVYYIKIKNDRDVSIDKVKKIIYKESD